MKIILTALLFIISVFYPFKSYSQTSVKQPTRQPEDPWLKLDNQFVSQLMENMDKQIMEGHGGDPNSKILSESQLKYFAGNLDKLYKHPDTEKVTRISRDWYLQLSKIVLQLANCSMEINMAVLKIEKDKMKLLNSKYDELKKSYKKLYDNPERPKPKR
jgi:hypothetical protein